MPTGSIAIVDDDEAVRSSSASLLTRSGFDVEIFESGDDFLSAPAASSADCVLLDVQMPGSDGLTVLRALAERGTAPPVLVITAHGDIGIAVAAMKLGAYDFVEKPYPADALLEAIHKAIEARAAGAGARVFESGAAAAVGTLTARQRQVLDGIVSGRPNKIIAYELGLSVRTVEAYRSQMMERLGARGTAEAVRVAIAAGLGADQPAHPDPRAPESPARRGNGRDERPAGLFPPSHPR